MKVNMEKTKVMKISRQPSSPNTDYDRSGKNPENVEYFNYLGSMMINDASCTREIKSRIVMAKAAIDRKKTLSLANWT
jgi:hypothetical protein